MLSSRQFERSRRARGCTRKKERDKGGKAISRFYYRNIVKAFAKKSLQSGMGKRRFSHSVRTYRDWCHSLQYGQCSILVPKKISTYFFDTSVEQTNENLAKECVDAKYEAILSLSPANMNFPFFFSPSFPPPPFFRADTFHGPPTPGEKKISRRPLTTFPVLLSKDLTSAVGGYAFCRRGRKDSPQDAQFSHDFRLFLRCSPPPRRNSPLSPVSAWCWHAY